MLALLAPLTPALGKRVATLPPGVTTLAILPYLLTGELATQRKA